MRNFTQLKDQMEARMQQQLKASTEALVRQQEARQAQREQPVVLAAEGRMKARFDLQQAELQAVRAPLASHRQEFEDVTRAQLQDTRTLEDFGRREGWHSPEQVFESKPELAAERALASTRLRTVVAARVGIGPSKPPRGLLSPRGICKRRMSCTCGTSKNLPSRHSSATWSRSRSNLLW
jgi:hypothetical protein